MIGIILLAGAISVELAPYAFENPDADTYRLESDTDAYGRPFQWSTRHKKPGKSILFRDIDNSVDYLEGMNRDAFGRRIEDEN